MVLPLGVWRSDPDLPLLQIYFIELLQLFLLKPEVPFFTFLEPSSSMSLHPKVEHT